MTDICGRYEKLMLFFKWGNWNSIFCSWSLLNIP